jgi:hydrogenase expression/formation protein HypC
LGGGATVVDARFNGIYLIGDNSMCLAIPAQLIELRPNEQAVVSLGGIRKEISVALVDGVKPGDYVIVHVGHAIGVLDPEEAQRTLALFAQLQEAG